MIISELSFEIFQYFLNFQECESIFAKNETSNGEYIVRDGGKHALDFVLSVKSSDRVRHFRITMGQGHFSLVPTVKHKSMDNLINYYKKTHLFTESDGLKLLLKNILGENNRVISSGQDLTDSFLKCESTGASE